MTTLVVIAVKLLPTVSPKNSLATVNSNSYIYFLFRGAFPSFVYNNKLQCNEENLSMTYQKERARHEQMSCFFFCPFKSNIRETWRMILVSKADIFLSESLRILAERLSQSEIRLPLRQICYYSPSEEMGVFSTEIKYIEYGVQSVF